MSRIAKSDELFELYRQLDETAAAAEIAGTGERAEDEARYAASQWQLMWRKFIRNKAAITGGTVILLFYLAALFGQFIVPYTLTTRFRERIHMPPQGIHFFYQGKYVGPFIYGVDLTIDPETLLKIYETDTSKMYPLVFFAEGEPYEFWGFFETNIHLFLTEEGAVNIFGTDRQGRDMFTRTILGSQISLTIGLIGVFLSLFFGTVLGVTSGYYGGKIDDLIQRLIELVRSFPAVPLWMALSAALPPHWPPLRVYFAVTLILSLIGWTWLARQLRGKVLTLRNADFVVAAKLAGASDSRIIFKHLIPATLGHIIVVSTLAMPAMILAETALSFLGLGLRAPLTSWGVLLQEAQNIQSIALYPWVFIPAIFIAVSILAFNFLGDGLRDAADPYSQ
jgi:peptide/nickel transport system permease protein